MNKLLSRIPRFIKIGCLGLIIMFCGLVGLGSLFGDVDVEPTTEVVAAGFTDNSQETSEPTIEATETLATNTPEPTNTVIAPTDEPTASPSNIPRPTNSPAPTDTVAPTATVEPTNIRIVPTDTPPPATNTPVVSTNTPVPLANTLPPPTNTLVPTATFDAVGQCSADLYNCADFSSQSSSQAMFNSCQNAGYGDPHRLDFNNNNVACEVPDESQEAIFYNPPTPTPVPVLPTNTSAPATASVKIIAVDKRAEVVTIRNDGGVAQDLTNWLLRSERGNQDCSLYGSIQPGQTIQIWAESKNSGNGGINCGFNTTIWNNSERDNAVLFNAAGQEVSRFNS